MLETKANELNTKMIKRLESRISQIKRRAQNEVAQTPLLTAGGDDDFALLSKAESDFFDFNTPLPSPSPFSPFLTEIEDENEKLKNLDEQKDDKKVGNSAENDEKPGFLGENILNQNSISEIKKKPSKPNEKTEIPGKTTLKQGKAFGKGQKRVEKISIDYASVDNMALVESPVKNDYDIFGRCVLNNNNYPDKTIAVKKLNTDYKNISTKPIYSSFPHYNNTKINSIDSIALKNDEKNSSVIYSNKKLKNNAANSENKNGGFELNSTSLLKISQIHDIIPNSKLNPNLTKIDHFLLSTFETLNNSKTLENSQNKLTSNLTEDPLLKNNQTNNTPSTLSVNLRPDSTKQALDFDGLMSDAGDFREISSKIESINDQPLGGGILSRLGRLFVKRPLTSEDTALDDVKDVLSSAEKAIDAVSAKDKNENAKSQSLAFLNSDEADRADSKAPDTLKVMMAKSLRANLILVKSIKAKSALGSEAREVFGDKEEMSLIMPSRSAPALPVYRSSTLIPSDQTKYQPKLAGKADVVHLGGLAKSVAKNYTPAEKLAGVRPRRPVIVVTKGPRRPLALESRPMEVPELAEKLELRKLVTDEEEKEVAKEEKMSVFAMV